MSGDMGIDLNNKVALITGASRGIGEAIALKFASCGAKVIINYSNSEEGAKATLEKVKSYGVDAMIYQANVANFDEVKTMIDNVIENFGRLDIVVNNSGITKDKLLVKMDEKSFDDVIDVNLKGVFNVCKHSSKMLMKQRSGVIINMSSVVGINGNAGQINYSASKAGLIGMTKTMAREFAKKNIRANAIAPGFIESDMTATLSETVISQAINNRNI